MKDDASTRKRSDGGHAIAAGGLLVVLVAAAYLPVVRCGYIWDDDGYVLDNTTLRSLDGLRRIWCELTAAPQEYPQYYPLVYTSFWLEYHSWQTKPLGYHADNVLLHALAAVLLWRVLATLRVPGAWWAAALFGVHPVHVESVAWITERKNVLAGVFYMASALVYIRFALPSEVGAKRSERWGLYVVAVALFLCALLSKTVTCTLPAVLLIVLWWQRGRLLRRDVLALLPLFALGLAFGLLTSWMERRYVGAAGSDWDLDFLGRCLLAGRAPWFYAGKLLWPHPLVFIYPRWPIDTHVWVNYVYPLATLAVVATLWLARGRVGRAPLAAVLCFGATLFPALGFFNVYPMRYSYVADHFQYLASASILALVAAVATWLAHRIMRAPVRAWPVAALALATLGVLTWQQVPAYVNLETLWRDTLRKNPNSWIAHNNFGRFFLQSGKLAEARRHYEQAAALAPNAYEPQANLGTVLARQGHTDEAIACYRRGAELDPRQPLVHYNLAALLAAREQWDEAARHYRQALTLLPNSPTAELGLGWVLMKQGNLDEAAEHFRAARRLQPAYPEAEVQLGWVLLRQGQIEQAIACYRKALQLRPAYAPAHHQLATALARQGKIVEATSEYRETLRLDPNNVEARQALSAMLSEMHR
jgi:tetratricopeptide (TPR) repeat protein